ncbi:hypothetical protein AB6A40_005612 [Gnathostoma spinigerum]|uniref:Cell cycle control protein n=1 Tax=Gnathostoma spinigerum TaxID=75299 RepID=A0ABD6EG39_9BILA
MAADVSRSEQPPAPSVVKKNRPKNTRLRQQKLPAWQPVLTASTVIPGIFGVGAIFLPVGVVLYLTSKSVQEFVLDYTNQPVNTVNRIDFTLDELFEGDVYFYYGLDNFYQNHRRYMKSRSDQQLLGLLNDTGECEPYAYIEETGKPKLLIAPCGAVANSMFNDTFVIERKQSSAVPWTWKGVAWPVDRERKFRNPVGPTLEKAFQGTVKPPNWQKPVWELDPKNPENNGFLNTDFIVWMRTAALPNFRKLYRKLVRDDKEYKDGLPPGNYTLIIENNYPVRLFHGKKYFIISTISWAGGKNSFLGIMYIAVGCICFFLGITFVFIHLKFGSSLKDMSNLSRITTRY